MKKEDFDRYWSPAFDTMAESVFLLNKDFDIVKINKSFLQLIGRKEGDVIGKKCYQIVHGVDKTLDECPCKKSFKSEKSESRNVYEQSIEKWLNIRTTPLFNDNKELVGAIHLSYDITEQKKKEIGKELDYRSQKILGALLYISLKRISLEEQLQLIMENVVEIPWLALEKKGAVFLIEDKPDVLVMKAGLNINRGMLKTCREVPFGKCICGRAALSGKVKFVSSVDKDHVIRYDGMSPHGHYCVPIRINEKVIGVLNLYVKEGHVRNPKEEEFLTAIANIIAGIVRRKRTEESIQRTTDKLRQSMGGVIQIIVTTVEMRDPYTAGHQQRVSRLARAIAKELGLSDEEIDLVRMAGSIHDLGKITVPAEILSKPGRITEIEFAMIKSHPKTGYDILKKVNLPKPVAKIILQHHERIDGSGYPSGLSGEDILIEAKILAVADVVEAMASQRPYRPALGMNEALDEISKKKGILYDSKVVDICLKLFRKNSFNFEKFS